MAFSIDDLDIRPDELTGISDELVTEDNPDPITGAITEQEAKYAQYIQGYTLSESVMKRIVRILVLHDLKSRLGLVTDALQKQYDSAMKELEAVRDGKFGSLNSGASATAGAWGSKPKF